MKLSVGLIRYIVIIWLMQSCATSKTRKPIDVKTGIIIYDRYDIITEDKAQQSNEAFSAELEGFMSKGMDSIEKKKFLENPAHDAMKVISRYDSITNQFQIFNTYYWEPYKLKKDGTLTNKGKYTDRDSLYQCNKKVSEIDMDCKRQVEVQYNEESKIEYAYKSDERKTILGYDCFKIIASIYLKNTESIRTMELFVTEDIKINYHPFLHLRSFNNKYFIMEAVTYIGNDKGQRTEFKVKTINIEW